MPSRWMCALIGGVVAAHVALFIFALGEPDAMLEFDRAKGRLAGAQALAGAGSVAELVSVTAARPALGDYGWHGLVLRVFGGWLPAVQLVQLALLALSMWVLHAMVGHLGGSRSVRWTAVLLYALIPIDFMLPHLVASKAFFNPLLARRAARPPTLHRHGTTGLAPSSVAASGLRRLARSDTGRIAQAFARGFRAGDLRGLRPVGAGSPLTRCGGASRQRP